MFSTALRHRSSFKYLVPLLSSLRGIQLRESALINHDIAIKLPLDSSPERQNATKVSGKAYTLKLLLLSSANTAEERMAETLVRIKELLALRTAWGGEGCESGTDDSGHRVDVAVMFLLTETTETSLAAATTTTMPSDDSNNDDNGDNDAANLIAPSAKTSTTPDNQGHHRNPEYDNIYGQQAYARLMAALFNSTVPPSSSSSSTSLNHPNQDLSTIPILPIPSLASFENILRAYTKNFLTPNASNHDKTIERIDSGNTIMRHHSSSGSSSSSSNIRPREPVVTYHHQPGGREKTYSQHLQRQRQRQRRQLQLRLLSLCSTAAPLSERTTMAVARVFSSFRELADAAVIVSVEKEKEKEKKAGYMQSEGVAEAEAGAIAAEKWNQLKAVLDESDNGCADKIVAQMIEFWQEEWVVE